MEFYFLESLSFTVKAVVALIAAALLFAFVLRLTAPFPAPWKYLFSLIAALALPGAWLLGAGIASHNRFLRTLFSDTGIVCMIVFPIGIFIIHKMIGLAKTILIFLVIAAICIGVGYLFFRQ